MWTRRDAARDVRVAVPAVDPSMIDFVTAEHVIAPGKEKMFCSELSYDGPDTGLGKGTVKLTYSVTDGVKTSANLRDPLLGIVYGNLFLQEDVGVFGPRNGAEAFGAVETAAVDLRSAASSAESFTGAELPAGAYVFLGFYDVDANGATSKDPDPGDPVTQALTNKFDLKDATQTELTVKFELVFS